MFKLFEKNKKLEKRMEPESFRVPEIVFIGEQDGNVEKELKAHLVGCFKANVHVAAAYLVRVKYGNSKTETIALCVKVDGENHSEIANLIGSQFKKMFKPTESLDIIFLTPEQEPRISIVAKSFYQQELHRT